MRAKEKAEKLVDKYLTASFGVMEEYIPVPMVLAKQCALIAVDEILESHYKLLSGVNTTTYKYWEEVKKEIKLL